MKKIKALLFIISVSLVLGISASCSTDSSSSESSDLDYSLVTKPSLLNNRRIFSSKALLAVKR